MLIKCGFLKVILAQLQFSLVVLQVKKPYKYGYLKVIQVQK